jgi:hypothetical protein
MNLFYTAANNRNQHIPYSKEFMVQIKIEHLKKKNIKYVIYQKLNVS